MATKTDAELKAYFESGDKPTQGQFGDLIDSKRNVLDKIVYNDLHDDVKALFDSAFNRTVLLPDGTYQWTAPAGTIIEKFLINEWPVIHAGGSFIYTVSIGTTPGGTEFFNAVAVDIIGAPNDGIMPYDHYCKTDTIIYFTITPPMSEPNKALIKILKS